MPRFIGKFGPLLQLGWWDRLGPAEPFGGC